MLIKRCYFIIIVLLLLITNCFNNRKSVPSLELKTGEIIRMQRASYYLPTSYTSSGKFPLIVLLHGYGDLEYKFLNQNEWIEEAEKRGYILCAQKSYAPYWSDEKDSPDINNIKKLIIAMEENFSIRDDKICIFGWSSGANFASSMLFFNKHPYKNKKLFTAFIAGSGDSGYTFVLYMMKGRIPGKYKIPGYIFWGDKEPTHPGEETAQFLSKNNWDITTSFHNGGHFIPTGGIKHAFDWLDEKNP